MPRLSILCLLIFSAIPAIADTVSYSLTSEDPSDFSLVASAGYQASYSADGVTTSKQSGYGNGVAFLESNFYLNGNFTITVDVNAAAIVNDEAGLGLNLTDPANTGSMDIYYISPNSIWANLQGVSGTHTYDPGGDMDELEITRVGSVITSYYNSGSGFQELNQATEWTAPASMELMFLTENGSSNSASATFSNLVITADSFTSSTPEPGTMWLLVGAIPVVVRMRSVNR